MIASKPEIIHCAVPGCLTPQKTNCNWYVIPGSVSFSNKSNDSRFKNEKLAWLEKLNIKDIGLGKDIHVCPLHFCDEKGMYVSPIPKSLTSASSVTNTVGGNKTVTIQNTYLDSSKYPPKQQISTIRCVVPDCPSGQKGFSSVKWYVLPGFKKTQNKDLVCVGEEEAFYSKLNIPRLDLGKTIQVCSNHFQKKDANNLNIWPQAEDFEEQLQLKIIYKKDAKSNAVIATNDKEVQKVNFSRANVSVGGPGLILTQKQGNDGNVHLKYCSRKTINVGKSPFGNKGKKGVVSKGKLVFAPKFFPPKNVSIRTSQCRSRTNQATEGSQILPRNVQSVTPSRKEKKENDKPVQLEYCSKEGTVYHITVDKDVKIKEELQEQPLLPKTDFTFVDVQQIINPESVFDEAHEHVVKQEVEDIEIPVENSNQVVSERLNEKSTAFNETTKAPTKDASTQTYFGVGFGEIVDVIRKHILNFQFNSYGRKYVINDCSLFFQPLKVESTEKSILKVGLHRLSCTNLLLLKSLNFSLGLHMRQCGKTVPTSSGVYTQIDGYYEVNSKIKTLNTIDNKNVVMLAKEKNIENSLKIISNQAKTVVTLNKPNVLISTLSAEAKTNVQSLQPKVKILKPIDIKDQKLKTGLRQVLDNWCSNKSNLPKIIFKKVQNNYNEPPKDKSILKRYLIENEVDCNQMKIQNNPTLLAVNRPNQITIQQVNTKNNGKDLPKLKGKIVTITKVDGDGIQKDILYEKEKNEMILKSIGDKTRKDTSTRMNKNETITTNIGERMRKVTSNRIEKNKTVRKNFEERMRRNTSNGKEKNETIIKSIEERIKNDKSKGKSKNEIIKRSNLGRSRNDASNDINIKRDVLSLRRSGRMRKTVNFAEILKRPYGRNFDSLVRSRTRDLSRGKKLHIESKSAERKKIRDINRKRKCTNDNISLESESKKGKFAEMIGELEKFLELKLEEPSEEDASLLAFDECFKCAYCLVPITSDSSNHEKCSEKLQKKEKSLEPSKKIDKKRNANSIRKTSCPISVKPSKNKIGTAPIAIDQGRVRSKRDESILTRSKTKITKKVENRPKTIPREKMPRKKPKNSWKVKVKDKTNKRRTEKPNKDQGEQFERLNNKKSTKSHAKTNVDKTGIDSSAGSTGNIFNKVTNTKVAPQHLKSSLSCLCRHCNLSFNNLDLLRKHLLTLDDCLSCEECRVIFLRSDIDTHQKHCKSLTRTTIVPLKNLCYIYTNSDRLCKLCLESFESFRKFANHVVTRHRNERNEINLRINTKYKILKKYRKNTWKNQKCRLYRKLTSNMRENIDHYPKCKEGIVENSSFKSKEGTLIQAELVV